MKPIAVVYEHPEWFKPLFAELDRLGAPVAMRIAGRWSPRAPGT